MERENLIKFLEELRKRLIMVAASVIITAIICFFFIDYVLYVLTLPGEATGMKLIFIHPSEALLANLRLSFVAATLVILPLILYQVVALILIFANQRRNTILLTLAMYLLFGLGVSFAYFVVFPFALNFFLSFTSEDVVASFSIARYISFVTTFILSFGLVFQLPLVFWFLGSIGVVNTSFLRQNRKYALLLIVIFAAILTPPDVFSQILMVIPLMLLYELGTILVAVAQRRKLKTESYQ